MERAYMIFMDICYLFFILFLIFGNSDLSDFNPLLIVVIIVVGGGYCFKRHLDYYKKTKKYF